jgi:hypothetical protein
MFEPIEITTSLFQIVSWAIIFGCLGFQFGMHSYARMIRKIEEKYS